MTSSSPDKHSEGASSACVQIIHCPKFIVDCFIVFAAQRKRNDREISQSKQKDVLDIPASGTSTCDFIKSSSISLLASTKCKILIFIFSPDNNNCNPLARNRNSWSNNYLIIFILQFDYNSVVSNTVQRGKLTIIFKDLKLIRWIGSMLAYKIIILPKLSVRADRI